MFAIIYIWFLLWYRSLHAGLHRPRLCLSVGRFRWRLQPRKSERSAGDEEANFYKNGMKIKTSEGIMD